MVDNKTYSLWQTIDKQSEDIVKLRNALLKVSDNHHVVLELDQIESKPRNDVSNLSDRRREELGEMLIRYTEPLMDKHEHDTHLQSHRKYLERLTRLRKQDMMARGLSAKGIHAEDMAAYSFNHASSKGQSFGSGQGLVPSKGMDPETGQYTIILKYEGLLTASTFKKYIRKYTSSGKIDLYETIKSLFIGGKELGLTKAQVGEVLVNILDTKEVKEAPDKVTADIFKSEMPINPHKTILRIIKMVSRNVSQAHEIKEKLEKYVRPKDTGIDLCISTVEMLAEEYFRYHLPAATEEHRKIKSEEKVLTMLDGLCSSSTRRELRERRKENDNSGIENNLDNLRKFLSKVEGDKRQSGGQSIDKEALKYMSYYNGEEDSQKPPRRTRSRERRRGRSEFRSPSFGSQSSARTSRTASPASTPGTSRGSSAASFRRRTQSSDHSRASSINSNFSTPSRSPSRNSKERKPRSSKEKEKEKKKRDEKKKREEKKKKESHLNERKERKPRDKSKEKPQLCPLCYEEECANRGKEKCVLRPDLIYDNEKVGACGICKRGYHVTTRECLDWPKERRKLRLRRTSGGSTKN